MIEDSDEHTPESSEFLSIVSYDSGDPVVEVQVKRMAFCLFVPDFMHIDNWRFKRVTPYNLCMF